MPVPEFFSRLWGRILFLLKGRRFDLEIDEEMRFHLDMRTAENISEGMTPAKARRTALRQFGSMTMMHEDARQVWILRAVDVLAGDLRYAIRILFKNPGFTAVAVLTLALGIGANAAIFSVVNAVLFRPLPFKSPERLMRVSSVFPSTRDGVDGFSYPNFEDCRDRNHVFDGLAVYRDDSLTLTGVGTSEHLRVLVASASLPNLLGIEPQLGSAFSSDDDEPGKQPSVMISDTLWRRSFGADPAVIGRLITLDGSPFMVIGVLPRGSEFPIQAEPIDLWITVARDRGGPGKPMAVQRGAGVYDTIGRLKPGIAQRAAQAEMEVIAAALGSEYPAYDLHLALSVAPELDLVVKEVRVPLLILLGAVGCVLLIACTNVANLLLARATVRRKEIALRAALGATRSRIVRQLVTESILLSMVGGAVGLALAVLGNTWLIRLAPDTIPRLHEARIDVGVLAFTLIVSMLTGFVFGLAPAIHTSRSDLNSPLKDGGRGASENASRVRLRDLLVVVQIALSLVLLAGGGLLVRSFQHLTSVNPGFNPSNLLTFQLSLPGDRYPAATRTVFYSELISHIQNLPGVRAASAAYPLPLTDSNMDVEFEIAGQPSTPGDNPVTDVSAVRPGYFQTAGVNIREGRDFAETDAFKTQPVAIVNRAFAEKFFPGEDPVGKQISLKISTGGIGTPMRQIVGVVDDIKFLGLSSEGTPQAYAPHAQLPFGFLCVAVRTDGDPRSLMPAIRDQMAQIDPDVPAYRVKTMEDYLAGSLAPRKFAALLLTIFAGVAVTLTFIGLYGVLSYHVAQHTREIGIRIALGASRNSVVNMMVKQGMITALIGVTIGLVTAFMTGRLVQSLLFQVSPTDHLTFFGVTAGLCLVSLSASAIPAWRAARVDPMTALRIE